MSKLKPGQIHTIHGTRYRAKRSENHCQGCDLNSIKLCPNIVDLRTEKQPYDCILSGVIFKKLCC